jgi:rhomboid family GlyGly-CTERM serine protease
MLHPDLWLLAGCVLGLNLHLGGIGSPSGFVFWPREVLDGQWWRLLTHPFVHLTFYHLILDAGAFFILYAGLDETRIRRKLALVGVAGFASLGAGLFWAPGFDRLGLCGLSGIAHGLMAFSGLEMVARDKHRVLGWLSFGTVAVKNLCETINGEVLFAFLHMGLCGTPLAACHLGGVGGGTLLFFFFWRADRHETPRRGKGLWLYRCAGLYARLGYRLRIVGAHNIPAEGPAVIVSNHVSYVDPSLIAAACPRPIRFVMYASYFRLPVLNRFFRAVGAIPIASGRKEPGTLRRALRQIDQALASGELVCIFPEGKLTRDGNIGRFMPGIERILSRSPVPVVPVTISGMWGSVSSYRCGPPLKKLPRRFRAPVAVYVADRVSSTAATAPNLRGKVAAGLESWGDAMPLF